MSQTHHITFEPLDIEMEVEEDEKILDAAFRQGIHLMHGCREGQCSACKSYMLEGDVQMERWSTFACNDSEVEEGYVLLCRGHAYSDCTIELLNFDEEEMKNAIDLQDVDMEVVEITPMTSDIVSLKLKADAFVFHPGQYADITIPGTEDRRSFSMATTQSTPGEVEFLIKKYEGGHFSGLLDDGISVGDTIKVSGPYGRFTIKEGHVLPVVCIAGGAGMAPVLSLLRHLSETESTRPVRFYYGARTAADMFYVEEIVKLGERLADFKLVVGLSSQMPTDGEDLGYEPQQGMITDIVEANEPELRSTELYLCGPPPMVDAALELAERKMVPDDQVFHDSFTSPLSEE